ncbi:YdeI/OmpD-associated family protein [Olivibacter sp. XZL3]|uniref:YdeI/OmpD-associated family protein n=1 Tax=Olivibacter sp. XZL3 TaxID=1735116 RepID=UPI001064B6AE|nr:YdeI/OmpD-associated family protein [Olivibacter sp. XZL3]
MLSFQAQILKFDSNGEKSGWSYIEISRELAQQLKAGYRRSFRVRGKIDQESVVGLALTPMGEGHFILALKASLRKKIGKEEGDVVQLELEEDIDFKIEIPTDLESCLCEDETWINQFLSLAKSHQHYFIKWINEAKTEITRTKRIALTVEAMEKQLDFGAMIRMDRARRNS